MFESWNVQFFHLEWEFDEFAVRLCWGKWFNSGWNEKHNGQHWWGVMICHAGGELLRDHEHFFKLIWKKEYMFAWWILIGGRQSILSPPQWQGIHFIPQLHDSSRSIIVFIATLLYLQYGHLLQTCVLGAALATWEELPKMQKASEELEKRKDDAEKATNLSNFCFLGNGWMGDMLVFKEVWGGPTSLHS